MELGIWDFAATALERAFEYQLVVTVSDSSVNLDTPKRSGVAVDVPSFRSFNSSFMAVLRDGQTMQYTSATDPVSGEVMKIDLTATVMK